MGMGMTTTYTIVFEENTDHPEWPGYYHKWHYRLEIEQYLDWDFSDGNNPREYTITEVTAVRDVSLKSNDKYLRDEDELCDRVEIEITDEISNPIIVGFNKLYNQYWPEHKWIEVFLRLI
jgi:hypothetical protein